MALCADRVVVGTLCTQQYCWERAVVYVVWSRVACGSHAATRRALCLVACVVLCRAACVVHCVQLSGVPRDPDAGKSNPSWALSEWQPTAAIAIWTGLHCHAPHRTAVAERANRMGRTPSEDNPFRHQGVRSQVSVRARNPSMRTPCGIPRRSSTMHECGIQCTACNPNHAA
jgi:hypothetical protein